MLGGVQQALLQALVTQVLVKVFAYHHQSKEHSVIVDVPDHHSRHQCSICHSKFPEPLASLVETLDDQFLLGEHVHRVLLVRLQLCHHQVRSLLLQLELLAEGHQDLIGVLVRQREAYEVLHVAGEFVEDQRGVDLEVHGPLHLVLVLQDLLDLPKANLEQRLLRVLARHALRSQTLPSVCLGHLHVDVVRDQVSPNLSILPYPMVAQ